MQLDERQAAASRLLESWSSTAMDQISAEGQGDCATEIGQIACETVFVGHWVRPGLVLRDEGLTRRGS